MRHPLQWRRGPRSERPGDRGHPYQQSSFYAEQYRLIRLSAMYNERLKAEQLKSIDLGLGIQIAGAHSLDLNLYQRDTRDALLEREIPSRRASLVSRW